MSVRAAPGLMAEATGATPARVVKRLDADRSVAARWGWKTLGSSDESTDESTDESSIQVTTDTNETVTLRARNGVVATLADVGCTCLLTPRCFHVLAVVASLPLADEAHADAARTEAGDARAPSEVASSDASPSLEEDARRVALDAWRIAGELLAAGAQSLGAVHEGALLRIVHLARVHGLHRLSRAGLRFVRDVRALRDASTAFEAASLVDDLADFARTARHLVEDAPLARAHVGVSRRAYEQVGHLRLTGLCCEAVVARAGFAGVVTHLVDDRGGLWSIGDVLAGDVDRARGAYDASIAMGDTSITHRALSRALLFIQDATASIDRRLGAGRNVKAVAGAARRDAWSNEAILRLFSRPIVEQLRHAHRAFDVPEEERPRGARLVFVRGVVVGHEPSAVRIETAAGVMRLVPSTDGDALACRDNLRQLARAVGATIDLVGAVDPQRPQTLQLVAFAPVAEETAARLGSAVEQEPPPRLFRVRGAGDAGGTAEPAGPRSRGDSGRSQGAASAGGNDRSFLPCPSALALPEALGGLVNASYDRLVGAQPRSPGVGRHAPAAPVGDPQDSHDSHDSRDPLEAMRRRTTNLALHGVRAIASLPTWQLDRDTEALCAAGMSTAAAVLAALFASALRRRGDALTRAWLTAHTFLSGAGASWRAGG